MLPHPAGRNRRSVWTVATAPYPGAHFATFSPKLIEPCILAGTSEEGCCAECGAPWERTLGRNEVQNNEVIQTDKAATTVPGLAANTSHDRVRKLDGKNYQHVRGETTGWRPTCTHEAKPIPCTVLDPFMGSGTTGAVARDKGCRFVGIELSEEYIQLALRRFDQPLLF